ncbi:MAG: hypothetical protein MZV64_13060 [Ignavibacteriales bacterium]|nr:hypothetical protein [Ignavibacteriales bacterium]
MSSAGWARRSARANRARSAPFLGQAGWPVAGEIRGARDPRGRRRRLARRADRGHRPRLPDQRRGHPPIPRTRRRGRVRGRRGPAPPLGRPRRRPPPDVHAQPGRRRKLLGLFPAPPRPFPRSRLLDMGFELLEVPDEEYPTMATNVLALAPGRCLALAGNPRTAAVLEKAGIEVLTYRREGDLGQGRRRPDLPDQAIR